MNERQITIDGHTYTMAQPFLVIATQNPVEHHGTYPLPESQLDRFLMRLRIGYPDAASERDVMRGAFTAPAFEPVLDGSALVELQDWAARLPVEDSIAEYMLALVAATRAHDALALGVSPRGAQALYRASQALAVLEGRDYVIPDDPKRLAVPLFAHRVVVNGRLGLAQRSTEAAERVIAEILNRIAIPL
jgi:MoxR-like ATPase